MNACNYLSRALPDHGGYCLAYQTNCQVFSLSLSFYDSRSAKATIHKKAGVQTKPAGAYVTLIFCHFCALFFRFRVQHRQARKDRPQQRWWRLRWAAWLSRGAVCGLGGIPLNANENTSHLLFWSWHRCFVILSATPRKQTVLSCLPFSTSLSWVCSLDFTIPLGKFFSTERFYSREHVRGPDPKQHQHWRKCTLGGSSAPRTPVSVSPWGFVRWELDGSCSIEVQTLEWPNPLGELGLLQEDWLFWKPWGLCVRGWPCFF